MAIRFNCASYDRFGNYGGGFLRCKTSLSAVFTGISNSVSTLTLGGISIDGGLIISYPQSGDALDISGDIRISGDYITDAIINAKIQWSDIGSFSFDIDKKNIAGEAPLNWKGYVWKIIPLGSDIMVYGSGGITKLTPKGNVFGMQDLSKVGIANAWSISGTDKLHMFVDKRNRLCKVVDKIYILGYEEYLEEMTNPILLYDELNQLVFICDGTYGYIYSIEDESLGTGPINLTGIGYSEGVLYVVASGTVAMPKFEILTDIIDLGTRKHKTIQQIEVGTNLSRRVFNASVEYNSSLTGQFRSVGWHSVTPEGVATIHCFGKEFKIGIKCLGLDEFEIDYVKIRGFIHDYDILDS
jgi:hypothetical protein